jgi:tetratricopeptide (TPR) repeat protein
LRIKEKLPLFALTLGSITVTIVAQASGGAMKAGALLSLSERVDNALISYVRYLAKAVYPSDLAIFYPHPGGWETLPVVASAALLVAITGLVLWRLAKQPYLAVGWFWFLGTLVPVIGLVQVGSQAMADRYTYVPYLGLFIAVVWAVSEWMDGLGNRARFVQAAAVVVIAGYAGLSWQYASTWKNTISVFTHSLSSTDDAYLALVGRGPAPEKPSMPIHNGLYTPYYNLGTAFAEAGLNNKARVHFEAAIKANASFPEVYINMGVVLAQQGDLAGSARNYEKALAVDPGNTLAQQNLAFVRQMLREQAGR